MSSSAEEESDSGGGGGPIGVGPRRSRQRVDAGEPRNSYASIPNFASRGGVASRMLSSSPPLGPKGGASSSGDEDPEFRPNGPNEAANDKSVLLREILQSGNNNNNNNTNNNNNNKDTSGARLLKRREEEEELDEEEEDEMGSEGEELKEDLDDEGEEPGEEYEGGDEEEEESKMMNGSSPLSQTEGGGESKDEEEELEDEEEELEDEEEEEPKHVPSDVKATSASAASTEVDLKRARVENIISCMRSSPSRVTPGPDTGAHQVNGCKKRKLYQPQQHESARGGGGTGNGRSFRLDSSDYDEMDHFRQQLSYGNGDLEDYLLAKRQKVAPALAPAGPHQEFWKEQVSEMQAQIAAIQKKLTEIYDVHSSDSDSPPVIAPAPNNNAPTNAPPQIMQDQQQAHRDTKAQNLSKPNGNRLLNNIGTNNNNNHNLLLQLGYKPEVGGSGRGMTATKSPVNSNDLLDPIHFIDEARRMVHEQERLAKMETCVITSTPAESKVSSAQSIRTGQRVVSPDWEVLADNLKAGMANLIDDWVRRCSLTQSINQAKSRSALINNNNITNHNNNNIDNMLSSLHHGSRGGSGMDMVHHHHHHPTTPSPSIMIPPTSTSSGGSGSGVLGGGNSLHLSDRRSPRTKVIDRGRGGSGSNASSGGGSITSGLSPSANAMVAAAAIFNSSNHGQFATDLNHHLKPPLFSHPLPLPPPPPLPSGGQHLPKVSLASLIVAQQPYYGHLAAAVAAAASASNHNNNHSGGNGSDDMCGESPEQSGPLSLVVTPKKKRSKVTDKVPTRTLNRHFGQPDMMETGSGKLMLGGGRNSPLDYHHHHPSSSSIVPVSLPTSVAIPNPSLVHQSDNIFSPYPYYHPAPPPLPHAPLPVMQRGVRTGTRSPSPSDSAHQEEMYQRHSQQQQALRSTLLALGAAGGGLGGGQGGGGNSSPDLSHLKSENGGGDSSECNSNDMSYDGIIPISSTLTPMHLRKAKLMFFFVRYPSSSILKAYFPDIKFNKNNTAQLVKWFSNFREFYYIQMEKYARQALSEGCKLAEDLVVTLDSELYRVLNLHYNRNNHIEVPTHFRYVVEQTLREFFKAVSTGKDSEQSWKKAIYKVIARLDDNLPDYFKSPNFLEQLE